MAKFYPYLSAKTDASGYAQLHIRMSICRGKTIRIPTDIRIEPKYFKDGRIVIPKITKRVISASQKQEQQYLREADQRLINIERSIEDLIFSVGSQNITKGLIIDEINKQSQQEENGQDKEACREISEIRGISFKEAFQKFYSTKKLSKARMDHYHVLERSLNRFEAYLQSIGRKEFRLDIKTFTADDIRSFEEFYRTEHKIYIKHPRLYNKIAKYEGKLRKFTPPAVRGDNTIVCTLERLKSFFNWCVAQDFCDKNPFHKYDRPLIEHYGTPYYLTIQERDIIADYDLSAYPSLATQRDIFIFQCLVGCRVSDLMRLTDNNIIGGFLEYVASKTRGTTVKAIRIPLMQKAKDILDKYNGVDTHGRILPFISSQKYNQSLKRIFEICGITRMVTIIDPKTSEQCKRKLSDIASSHLARRTFCANLYKKVKDPELVGAMSGHAPGSKAFTRYREIDDELKMSTINLLAGQSD